GRGGKRYRDLLWEKGPFFALAVASSAVTYVVQQQGGTVASFERFSLVTRISNAAVAYATYVWKMIWPLDLSILYPHRGNSLPVWQIVGGTLVIVGISALAVVRRRTQRYFLVGWFCYLITLLPVIGIIQVGEHSMADRYTYIPLVGL